MDDYYAIDFVKAELPLQGQDNVSASFFLNAACYLYIWYIHYEWKST